jgi:hypothetical protein
MKVDGEDGSWKFRRWVREIQYETYLSSLMKRIRFLGIQVEEAVWMVFFY